MSRGQRHPKSSIIDFRNRTKKAYSRLNDHSSDNTEVTAKEIEALIQLGANKWNQKVEELRNRFEDPNWVVFENLQLNGVDFTGYNLQHIIFAGGKFSHCKFQNIITQNINLFKSELTNCEIANIKWVDPTVQQQRGPTLDITSCKLDSCSIHDIHDLYYWDMNSSELTGTNIKRIHGEIFLWHGNIIKQSNIENVSTVKINWEHNQFNQCNFLEKFIATQNDTHNDSFDQCDFRNLEQTLTSLKPFTGLNAFKPSLANFTRCHLPENSYEAFNNETSRCFLKPKIFNDNSWYDQKGNLINSKVAKKLTTQILLKRVFKL